jgi:hypothetical protein
MKKMIKSSDHPSFSPEPDERIPVKPDADPDPLKKKEVNDPTRIQEPDKQEGPKIDDPPSRPSPMN